MKYHHGLTIVSLVSLVILPSASSIVYAVVTEKHSSPILLASEIHELNQEVQEVKNQSKFLASQSQLPAQSELQVSPDKFSTLADNTQQDPEVVNSSVVLGITDINCELYDQLQVLQKTNSVVNYLKTLGEKANFESRVALAQSMGIENYSGSAEQNLQILHSLQSKYSQELASCAETPAHLLYEEPH